MKQLSKDTSTLLFIMLTGVLIIIAFISNSKLRQFNQSVNWVMHTQLVKTNLEEVISNLKDAETGQRGYLLSNDTVFLEPYTSAKKRIMPLLASLDSLSTDNAMQKEHLKKLETLVAERYEMLKKNLNLLKNRQPDIYTDAALLTGKNKMNEVRKQINLMLQTEDTLLQQRLQVKDRSASITPIFLLLLSLFAIVAITLFFFRLQKETTLRVSTQKIVEIEAEARKKIEESEQDLKRYKHMADNATEPFILMRQDGTFAYLNDLALKRWGYTKEEAQHIRVPHVDPVYNDEVFNAVFAAAQKEKIPQFETLHKKKDGTIYPVEINMGGLTLEGKPHMFAIARDITERKKLEEAVRESEEKIRSFILQAPVAMCLYRGPQHIIEIVNAELLSIWDKPLDSVINKPVFEALPEARGQGFEALLDKVYTTGEEFTAFGIPIVLPRNGKPKTIYVNLVYQAYREVDGSISGIVEVVSDATEQVVATQQIAASEMKLQQSIADLKLATDSANVGTWSLNIQTQKLEWSALHKKMWGYDETRTDLIYEDWHKIILPADKELAFKRVEDARINHNFYEVNYRINRADNNEIRSIRSVGKYHYNEKGEALTLTGISIDITEQLAAETKIKESENQFRTFADSIQNLAWIANGNGWIYWYNQQWYDYTGTTLEEMQGWGWDKVHHPAHIKKVVEFVKQAWKKDEPFELTFPLRRHDGEFRWFLTRAYPVKDANGNIERWIGTNTDITEQKSFTEELEIKVKERTYQLHIQNETFKQAEESSMQGSYSFNLTTGKLAYSDNLYRLIGYLPNEFEPSLEEFNNHVHPDDRDYVTQAAQKVLQNKTAEEWYYRMNTKTGTLIHIKGTGRVIESGDEIILVGTLQDVTKEFELNKELLEKEEYRKQIINNAPDAVIVINEKSIITLWNPKTEEIFGWQAEEVIGLHLTDTIIPMQYRQAHSEGMKRLLKTGEARILNKTLELTALNKEGKEFPISLTISQSTQQGNKLFIAFLKDITLEKQNKKELIDKTKQVEEINQTLALKNKELENSNAELESFNYVASHDLQEPLRKIQAFSKRIIDKDGEKLSDTTIDYFNRIRNAAQRMQNLIKSLLDFSRTNLDKVVFEETDLNHTLAEVKNVLYESIKQKNAVIESQSLPTLNAVPLQMQQLFLNIIGNSLKYSKPGVAPHIKITAEKITSNDIAGEVKQNGTFWKIAISDNGIGFEQQYENKIFEVFQRLHGKTEYEGTGIGLAICKKIVQGHNGTITATAQLDVGATFTFFLPDNN